MPFAGLCALHLLCAGCSSDRDPNASSAGGAAAAGAGAEAAAGAGSVLAAGAGSVLAAGAGGVLVAASAGSAGKPNAGESGGPPPAVDNRSVYALECHGDSKDCNLASVPCFGVSSPTPNVAAGWACANRCASNADCSDAASGAEARAGCVSFASTGHCMLVCRNENQTLSCPDGMTCYVPPKSPVGYCLWQ